MSPETLAALHALSFDTPRPWSAPEFEALLHSHGCFLNTLGEDGFILGRVIAGESELLTLAVAPTARKQGHGRALLGTYETTARTLGATDSFLEVAADNQAAISLYLGAGYEKSGLRKAYYSAPDGAKIDALVMTKRLLAG